MRSLIQHHAPASGFETLTVTNAAAVGPTAALITNRTGLFITCEAASIRYRFDGTDPTSTVGHLLNAGGYLEILNPVALGKIKFIAIAGNATLQATYY